MSYQPWPPPHQPDPYGSGYGPPPPGFPGPADRPRPSWHLPAAIAALVVTVLLAGATGWFVYTRVIRTDPGIAMCEAFRDDAADGSDDGDASLTSAEYHELRDEFEKSRHDDIRQAGIRLADVAWQFFEAGPNSTVRLAYQGQLLLALTDLQGACANHGVVIELDWNR